MSQAYDLVVIGSGPGGYVGAIHAAQQGLKTAIIEKNATLGGTCLNVGCIPAKALLFSAQMFDKAKKFPTYGVKMDVDSISLDWPQVQKRKDGIVEQFTRGVAGLMKKNKIDVYAGFGKVKDKSTVEVTDKDGKKTSLSTKNILLAMGSRVRHLPHIKADGKMIVTSDEVMSIDSVPGSLGIIGGGVIGCEFASAYGRFGSKVTIFEMSEQIVPTEDHETANELAKGLKKQNCEILTGVKVTSVAVKGKTVEVMIEGDSKPKVFDKVLLSVGRAPCTEDCGLEAVGVKLDRGFIPVDLNTYRTSVPNIYAVGDIIPTPQLAHTASAEAIYAVDVMIAKKRTPINYMTNPTAIYTYPEIASIGHTENGLKKLGKEYKIGKFPFAAIAKAKIDDAAEGFIKILVDTKYGEVLGVHIVHAKATELIAEFSLGNNLETTIEEIAHTIHPHPTISETVHEAAHAAMGHALHI